MRKVTIITFGALIFSLYASNVTSAPPGPPPGPPGPPGPQDYDYYGPRGPDPRFGPQRPYGNWYEDPPLSQGQQKFLWYEHVVLKYLKPMLSGLLGPLIPTIVMNFNSKPHQ